MTLEITQRAREIAARTTHCGVTRQAIIAGKVDMDQRVQAAQLALNESAAEIEHPVQWRWWADEAELNHKDEFVQPEHYHISNTTRDRAVEQARLEFPGQPIAIVEATFDEPFECDVFDAEHIIESIWEEFCDNNSDRWGEDGCEDRPSNDELADAMNAAFKEFIDRHYNDFNPRMFTATRNAEIIMPEEQEQ